MISLSPSGRQAEAVRVELTRPAGSLVFKTSSVADRMALPKKRCPQPLPLPPSPKRRGGDEVFSPLLAGEAAGGGVLETASKPPRKESHLHRRVQSSSCSCYTTRDQQAGLAGLEPTTR